MASPNKRMRLETPPLDSISSADTLAWLNAEDSPPPSPSASGVFEVRPASAKKLDEAIQKQFLNADYADFYVVSGDKRFPAHRSIVCQQSRFFSEALKDGAKEVVIADEDPKSILRLLSYYYTCDYSDKPSNPATVSNPSRLSTRINFNMYRLGTKLRELEFTKHTVVKQMQHLEETIDGISNAIWAARQCYRLFPGKHDAMRMAHVTALARQFHKAKGENALDKNEELRALCEEYGEFAYEFMVFCQWEREHHEKKRSRRRGRPYKWVEEGLVSGSGGLELEHGWEGGEGWGSLVDMWICPKGAPYSAQMLLDRRIFESTGMTGWAD
ncbi:hypothetical protein BJ508DRAFT_373352 [Ascobolus immersus RN42]|uniref:BTB domain-containing protein n=1 Tax=Ascobolus immersus RN42 TaxID=1160509 RepID=A0A3N4IJE8_ASCIM|nr:hypothetical protein BJ508DRAFT_373352 [Ascobolus immersus RN42]